MGGCRSAARDSPPGPWATTGSPGRRSTRAGRGRETATWRPTPIGPTPPETGPCPSGTFISTGPMHGRSGSRPGQGQTFLPDTRRASSAGRTSIRPSIRTRPRTSRRCSWTSTTGRTLGEGSISRAAPSTAGTRTTTPSTGSPRWARSIPTSTRRGNTAQGSAVGMAPAHRGAVHPYQHTTWEYGAGLGGRAEIGGVALNYHAEETSDSLRSTSLAYGPYHSRTLGKVVLVPEESWASVGGAVTLRAGAAYDDSDRAGGVLSPVAELARTWTSGELRRIYASYSATTEMPSYTALDSSPTSGLFLGNPNLGRQTSRDAEAGGGRGAPLLRGPQSQPPLGPLPGQPEPRRADEP